ncbi:cytochrome c3 family protein [Roseibium sp. LAB1]
MSLLRRIGVQERRYERPQDDWVCGHLADGCPCRQGPDRKGNCRAGPVCQPVQDDDRWICRRSSQEGGPCDSGPLPDGSCCQTQEPCVPKPSLRKRRRRAAVWLTALTAGLVAIILSGGAAKDYLMPGRLAAQHANLTDCQSCHADARPQGLGWLHGLAATAAGPKQTATLCTTCHDVGPQPFTAHTTPVEQLRQMTLAHEAKGRAGRDESWTNRIKFSIPRAGEAPDAAGSGSPAIYCATCHQEHQGSLGKLTDVSNDRCQTCHVEKFGRFEDSHPQFTGYPFFLRTGIIFDHKSHFGKHFPDTTEKPGGTGKAPAMCETCHEPGSGGRYMAVRDFEGMCASCHSGDLLGQTIVSGPKGTNFLSVPGLDMETLIERGIDIGAWPESSEAGITPFMRALLALVLDGRDIAGEVSDLDLLDLRSADEDDLAKVQTLAWAVKQLLANIERDGLPAAMGAEASDSETMTDHRQMALMVGVMPHDVIATANREWLPELSQDLAHHADGVPTRAFEDARQELEKSKAAEAGEASPPTSGQVATDILTGTDDGDDDGGLILGGGADGGGELASDDLLLAPAGADEAAPGDDILASEDTVAGDDIPLDSATDTDLSEGLDILADEGTSSGTDGDLLLGQPAGAEDILAGDDILAGEDTLAADEDGTDLLSDAAADASASTDGSVAPPSEQPFDPESWALYGGWYRQDHTIRYRPTGHEDPFLKTWLDYSGHAATEQEKALRDPVFASLSDPGAVGRCTKCHSVDTAGVEKSVRWQPFDPAQVTTRFTRFSHDPHISAVGTEGCVTCHALTTGADTYLKTYEQGDPAVHAPNFTPIDKATCATCHTERAAGEECTLCHQYHTGGFSLPLVRTEVPKE